MLSGINLFSAYRRPSDTLKTQDLNKLLDSADKVLIIGDLNSRNIAWKCINNNKSGNILLRYTQNHNCNLMYTYEPTYCPPNNSTPSTIDIGINKNISNISELSVEQRIKFRSLSCRIILRRTT